MNPTILSGKFLHTPKAKSTSSAVTTASASKWSTASVSTPSTKRAEGSSRTEAGSGRIWKLILRGRRGQRERDGGGDAEAHSTMI